jgi:hypothetical protein
MFLLRPHDWRISRKPSDSRPHKPTFHTALEEDTARAEAGAWNVFFGPVHLGRLDERDDRIHDRRGRTQRERHLSPIR